MKEYIEKDQALMQLTGRFPNGTSLEKYIGLVNFRLNGLEPSDVIEIEKITKAIKEMKALVDPENTILGFDEKMGVKVAMNILVRNIGKEVASKCTGTEKEL